MKRIDLGKGYRLIKFRGSKEAIWKLEAGGKCYRSVFFMPREIARSLGYELNKEFNYDTFGWNSRGRG